MKKFSLFLPLLLGIFLPLSSALAADMLTAPINTPIAWGTIDFAGTYPATVSGHCDNTGFWGYHPTKLPNSFSSGNFSFVANNPSVTVKCFGGAGNLTINFTGGEAQTEINLGQYINGSSWLDLFYGATGLVTSALPYLLVIAGVLSLILGLPDLLKRCLK